jgi:hypothetical protein
MSYLFRKEGKSDIRNDTKIPLKGIAVLRELAEQKTAR